MSVRLGVTNNVIGFRKGNAVTVKSSISLTDDQHSFVKTLVDDGRFPSVSAVLQQGVEVLRRQIETDALEHDALAEVLKRRRAGKFVSPAKMDDRLDRLLTRMRRTHEIRD
jgi:antitoxin ParD1/3/4